MNIFRGIVGNHDTASSKDSNQGAETIDRLIDRIQTATLYEDRRDAIKTIRALSKQYRLEVGSMAMPILCACLKEKSNPEIVGIALDALCCVIGESDEIKEVIDTDHDELGERFSEIFLKTKDNVDQMLNLLDEYEFVIRRPAINFFTGLTRHCAKQVQEALLQDPAAIARIMDLLVETREVLRNDSILLLCELTRGNPHIQKLVAYENAFQVLLDVVALEDDSSIVAEDCLFTILNLLKNNPSNQELFREQGLVPNMVRILHLLLFPDVSGDSTNTKELAEMGKWTQQRVANVIFVLQVIRCLVSPSNSPNSLAASQKACFDSGLFADLCQVLLANGVTVDVLSESLLTVAECMRDCARNQHYFAQLHAPDSEDKSVILVLLMSLANERQPADLRAAILYCFQSFVFNNSTAKHEIVSTLLPATSEQGTMTSTAGHYLCSMLVSAEPLQVFFSVACLMSCINNERQLKESLLRVQMAISTGDAPTTLLQQCMNLLTNAGQRKTLARVALLQFLATWAHDCPLAIRFLLGKEENLMHLTQICAAVAGGRAAEDDQGELLVGALAAYVLAICVHFNDNLSSVCNRKTLAQIISRRIGTDSLCDELEALSRSEPYVRALQRPYTFIDHRGRSDQPLLLDHQLAKQYKSDESVLLRTLKDSDEKKPIVNGYAYQTNDESNMLMNADDATGANTIMASTVVQSYKDLIKRQDAQLSELQAQLKHLQSTKQQSVVDLEKTHLEEQVAILNTQVSDLQQQILKKSQEDCQSSPELTHLKSERESLQQQVQQLTTLVQAWQSEANRFQQFAQQWQQYQVEQNLSANESDRSLVKTMEVQLAQQQQQLNYGWQIYEQQVNQLATITTEKDEALATWAQAQQEVASLKEKVAQLEQSLADTKNQFGRVDAASKQTAEKLARSERDLQNLKTEQEDLLVLLADQDAKLKIYRQRLTETGYPLSEDEDDDEEVDSPNDVIYAQETTSMQQQEFDQVEKRHERLMSELSEKFSRTSVDDECDQLHKSHTPPADRQSSEQGEFTEQPQASIRENYSVTELAEKGFSPPPHSTLLEQNEQHRETSLPPIKLGSATFSVRQASAPPQLVAGEVQPTARSAMQTFLPEQTPELTNFLTNQPTVPIMAQTVPTRHIEPVSQTYFQPHMERSVVENSTPVIAKQEVKHGEEPPDTAVCNAHSGYSLPVSSGLEREGALIELSNTLPTQPTATIQHSEPTITTSMVLPHPPTENLDSVSLDNSNPESSTLIQQDLNAPEDSTEQFAQTPLMENYGGSVLMPPMPTVTSVYKADKSRYPPASSTLNIFDNLTSQTTSSFDATQTVPSDFTDQVPTTTATYQAANYFMLAQNSQNTTQNDYNRYDASQYYQQLNSASTYFQNLPSSKQNNAEQQQFDAQHYQYQQQYYQPLNYQYNQSEDLK